MAQREDDGRLVYHGDRYVPFKEASLPFDSIALRFAISVFEGVRLYQTEDRAIRPWLLHHHITRLANSCRLLRLRLPEGPDKNVHSIVENLVRLNRVSSDAYARISVSASSTGSIDSPTDSVLTVSVSPSRRSTPVSGGLNLAISSWMRVPDKAFPAAAKSISQYAGARIAQIQAREAGYDGCILRASDGSLSDAPTAALFLIIDGGLHTAPLSSDVLPSITRAWVLATAVTARIPTHIHPISKDDVYQSDEAFLCGTAVELSSVRRIDNAAMRSWPARPITSRLLVAFAEQTRGRTGVPDFPLQLR